MSIRIITDSASDIVENIEGVDVVPMSITFGQSTFKDGVDLSHTRFYERLIESDELPVTGQVAAFAWGEAFSKALETADDVVCITLSSKLSGTYQQALQASEDFDGRVRVVDSLNAAVGERILVELATCLVLEGYDADQIAAELECRRNDVHLIALLDTLEYLKRGGRIDAVSAGIGNVLHVKPVIMVEDGAIRLLGKARGSKNGRNLLNQKIDEAGGINTKLPFAIGYTGLSRKLLDKYVADSSALWEDYCSDTSGLPIHTVGGTIGTHVGPGVVALAFFGA